jgi:hypothetical protein
MKPIKTLLATLSLVSVIIVQAQDGNPYKPIGKNAKVVTAYGDKFVEVFDYDTIQRIGSVLFNIKTKQIVKILPDANTFKKYANNSTVSRWYSVDPLADRYVSYSPYNFVLNNPIKLVDPDGRAPLDDYYSKKGVFLGSDGAATNDQRIISADTYYTIDSKNGGTTSQAATTELQASSKVITVAIPGGKSEGEYFQNLYNSGNGDGTTKSSYKEMTTTLLLDPENAVLKVVTGQDRFNGPSISIVDNPNSIPGVKEKTLIKIGDAHTHQVADLYPDSYRDVAAQDRGDGAKVAANGVPLFTIDSKHVDVFVPSKQSFSGRVGMDNIAPTQSLFNNNFSILRTALALFGGK